MNEILLKNMKFIKSTDVIEQFVKGWSGDKTYQILRGNQRYFLKIINENYCDFNNFDIYKKLNIKTPQILEKGELPDGGGRYYIAQFVEGEDLGDAFDRLSDNFIFDVAKNLGKNQRQISELFSPKISTNADKESLFSFYDKKIEQFFNLLENYKDKTQLNGKQLALYGKIVKIINKTKASFNNAMLYFCHDDFMPNNFMIDSSNQIWTIDIESTGYDFFAKKLRGYIQHLINKPNAKKFQIFFKGFLAGFFDSIPKNLDVQMEYIYLADLFDICASALQNNNIEQFLAHSKLLDGFTHKYTSSLLSSLTQNR